MTKANSHSLRTYFAMKFKIAYFSFMEDKKQDLRTVYIPANHSISCGTIMRSQKKKNNLVIQT